MTFRKIIFFTACRSRFDYFLHVWSKANKFWGVKDEFSLLFVHVAWYLTLSLDCSFFSRGHWVWAKRFQAASCGHIWKKVFREKISLSSPWLWAASVFARKGVISHRTRYKGEKLFILSTVVCADEMPIVTRFATHRQRCQIILALWPPVQQLSPQVRIPLLNTNFNWFPMTRRRPRLETYK